MTRRASKPATVKRAGARQGLPYDTLGLDAESLKKAILNVAKMGKFSSDRTIQEYAREIWRITPARI